jgi:hypothetical protein
MKLLMDHAAAAVGPEILPDHAGEHYDLFLSRLHRDLAPKSYLEVGTSTGHTLALARCASLAVDPAFVIHGHGEDHIGQKPICALFQMPSDDFFANHDPTAVLGRKVDLAFLDGMHRCEYLLRDFANTERYCRRNSVVVMHDCIPTEAPMADRTPGVPAFTENRNGSWTGDVWRTALALKHFRPDLQITSYDAPPTGLVCITNLSPGSTRLHDEYDAIVRWMLSMTLESYGIANLFAKLRVEPTHVVDTHEKLTTRFWL